MQQFSPFSQLIDRITGKHVIILGAGPTLDFCFELIGQYSESALFVVPDILAAPLLERFPGIELVIFSVEQRRHNYLKLCRDQVICIYENANFRNLPRNYENTFHKFGLAGELHSSDYTLLSPGTVVGVAAGLALALLKQGKIKNLFMFGFDLAYLDFRMYSRIVPGIMHSRLLTSEDKELYRVLIKSTVLQAYDDQIIRRPAEFVQSLENINKLVQEVGWERIYSTSPVGPSCRFMNPVKNGDSL